MLRMDRNVSEQEILFPAHRTRHQDNVEIENAFFEISILISILDDTFSYRFLRPKTKTFNVS